MSGMSSSGGAPAVRVSAPATIGNIACGFDVFGMAVERPCDAVIARATPEPGVTIARIAGDMGLAMKMQNLFRMS